MKRRVRHLIVLLFSICCHCCAAEASAIEITCEEASCIPSNSGEKGCDGTPFDPSDTQYECFGEDIDRYIEPCDTVECCLSNEECSDAESNTGNTVDSYITISHRLYPVNFRYYNLSIKLDFHGDPVEGYKVKLSSRVRSKPHCFCSRTEEFNVTLQYYSKVRDLAYDVTVDTFPNKLYIPNTTQIKAPQHCADCDPQVPYDAATCGLPRYEEPSVTLQCNGTHTNISWDEPYYKEPCSNIRHYTDIDKYYLTITTCDHQSCYFVVSNTTEVIIHTSDILDYTLYAYSQCSGLNEPNLSCSQPAESNYCQTQNPNSTCCNVPGCSPTPTKTPVPTDTSPHTNYVAVYICASVGGAIILISILVVLVLFFGCRRRSSRGKYIPTLMNGYSNESSPCECSALVIYSPDTAEQEKCAILQNLGPDLHAKGVSSSFPDMREPKQTLIDWISEKYEEVDAVFCVCNKEFSQDWSDSAAMQLGNDSSVAVRTLKELYEGDLANRGAVALHKYAVVLTKPNTEALIPAIMRTRKVFSISDTPALAEFASVKTWPA